MLLSYLALGFLYVKNKMFPRSHKLQIFWHLYRIGVK